MFDHSVYIAASYLATLIVLAWCAFSPLLKTKKVRARLTREFARDNVEISE
jgi:heme exporter protein CcmD